jgi:hypothetical protein
MPIEVPCKICQKIVRCPPSRLRHAPNGVTCSRVCGSTLKSQIQTDDSPCKICGEKPVYSNGLCRKCYNNSKVEKARASKHRYKVKNKQALRHKETVRLLKKNYNLTPEQYEAMAEYGGGGCWICGRPPKLRRLAVDHNHKTGVVRGLLCYWCNRGIGWFRDDPILLRRAASYLVASTTKSGFWSENSNAKEPTS